MRLGGTGHYGRGGILRTGRIVFINALLVVLFVGVLPAWATVTGPSSREVVAGNAVSVNIETTASTVVLNNPGYAGISASPDSGAGPTVRFTFTVGTAVAPGNYAYNFTDGENALSFILTVTAAPTTTTSTTTTQPPTTTTQPRATTTTEPATTTTTTTTTTATTTIGPPPTVSVSDGSATEGSIVWFDVTLSAVSDQPITVDYTTANGTATVADTDYANTSGVLTFKPGDTSETIAVPTGDDTGDEPDENFTVILSAPSNATISDGSGTGTINDDDPTVETTTTTTLPPTTTTSTLMPVAIAAPDDSGQSSGLPWVWLGGGLALLVLALAGRSIYSRRRRATLRPRSRAEKIGDWWSTSGPLVSYQERKSGRNAAKELQRRIEERRRLENE